MINLYTGFQTYDTFLAFYRCIEPTAQNMQSAYYQSSEVISLAERKRNMLIRPSFYFPAYRWNRAVKMNA
jgi:hypothetical protein